MRTILFLLISLACCSQAPAQWLTWTDATGNHKWSDKRNWDRKRLPTVKDVGVSLHLTPGPILRRPAALKAFLSIGTRKNAVLTLAKGGHLTVKTAVSLGCTDGIQGTLVMEKGSQLITDQVYIGNGNRDFGGRGKLIMNGGLIKCTYFSVLRARALRSRAHVVLKGGVVNCWDLMLCRDSILPPKVDIHGGKVVQRRNDVKRVRQWIHNGWIVGYNGKGDVSVKYNTTNHPDCTVITARPPTR